MNRLVVAMQISIDGCVSSTLADSTWQLWNWGPQWPWSEDLREAFNDLFADAAGILLSRPMADEGYLAHWDAMARRHPTDGEWNFSRAIGALPKFVVSRTGRPERAWPNTTVLNGEFDQAVARAKKEAAGDLLCFGGAGFVTSLLRQDLVDELRLFTNPGFAGSGAGIFGPWLADRRLRAAAAHAYTCGIAETRWVRHSTTTDA
ncbi:dihydrofolate reductase family protein [Kitasatospora sp. A2-31]|uniref:dihydrofolate reductase family protein n=1 Tax=Kitasatospora sp. A2-31 TaxID=2916414 RepID=UPI001EE9D501|nr:dihydrofolate reductase family protein [Kitasatospora sp. A2-31]MCG6494378.1 dihydrofolate reductase family protein [Kitasatospora sp. A2-31]MCG6500326.1 dihydrofolate reductase family protein [Kitasatospora sp. A2-31]MCG6500505.1 dihydrofolate reductase family protein [Kitasatospora sp. A2-31]